MMRPGWYAIQLDAAVNRLAVRQARPIVAWELVVRRQHTNDVPPRHELRPELLDRSLDATQVWLVIGGDEQDAQRRVRRRPHLSRRHAAEARRTDRSTCSGIGATAPSRAICSLDAGVQPGAQ